MNIPHFEGFGIPMDTMEENDTMMVETLKITGNTPGAPPEERRKAPRFELEEPVRVVRPIPQDKGFMVTRCGALNMSATGMLVASAHALSPGQRMGIEIPTRDMPLDVFMSEHFVGDATVVRIVHARGDRVLAALRFDSDLATNMEFSVFCTFMRELAPA